MVEVAALTGRIGFKVDGVSQANNEIQALQARIEQVGQAAATADGQTSGLTARFQAASPEIAALSTELDLLDQRLTSSSQEMEVLTQRATSLAPSMGEAQAQLSALRQEANEVRDRLADMGVSSDAASMAAQNLARDMQEVITTASQFGIELSNAELESKRLDSIMFSLGGTLGTDKEVLSEVSEELQKLAELEGIEVKQAEEAVAVHERLNKVRAQQARDLRQVGALQRRGEGLLGEVETGAPPPGAGRGGRGLNLTQTEITGLIRLMTSGRVGTEVVARGLQRITGAAAKLGPALLAVGAPIGVLVGAFKLAGSEIVQFGESLRAARPEVQGMYEELQTLQGFEGQALLGFLEQATNRLNSFGAINPTEIAGTIAGLADIAQFRTLAPGDAPDAARQIQRAVESISFEPLRDLGFPVDELNAKLKQLASEGMDQASQRAHVLAEVGRELQQDVLSGEAAARANAEYNTLAGVMQDIETIWASIGQDQALIDAARGFAATLREALPALREIAGWAIQVGKILLESAAGFVDTLNDIAFLKPEREAAGRFQELGAIDAIKANLRGEPLPSEVEALKAPFVERGEPIPQEIKDLEAQLEARGEEVADVEREMSVAEEATKRWEESIAALNDTLDTGFKNATDEATRALEKFQEEANKRQAGFGMIQNIRGLADAFDAMDEELNFATVGNTLQQFDQLLSQALTGGTEQIELLRLQAERLNEVGLLPDDAFREAEEMFGALEHVMAPIEAEARRMREAATEGTDTQAMAQQGVTSEAQNTNAALATAGSIIVENTNRTIEWAGALGSISVANPLGLPGVGTGLAPGARPGSPASEQPHGTVDRDEDRPTGEGGGMGTRNLRELAQEARRQAPFDFEKWREDQLRRFASPGGGRGGAGGAGGAADQLASIEEIRQLFRNINQLIKIGTNEGVFFSPAGNVIPRGGPNEFLNREGGVLVQTVNIRGIWDFADPAAKRQIMKELEEALAGLKKELG